MFNSSLLPWDSGKSPEHRRLEEHPFMAFQKEMNRAFDNFYKGFPTQDSLGESYRGFDMKVNVSEGEKDIHVTAELPGVDEKEIDLSIANNTLILKGEKKEEKEEGKGNSYYRECFYGSFHREIPLGIEIDESKVDASFKNGVLTVTLPKTEAAKQNVKKIAVKSS